MNIQKTRSLFFQSGLIPSIFHRTKVNIFQDFSAIEILKDGSNSAKLLHMDDILRYNSKKKIPLRDLRILSRLETRGQCSILPRPQSNCIIMEIENLRLICWKDRCILMQPASKIHQAFIAEITSSVVEGSKRTEELNNVLRLYQDSEEVEDVGFEHLVLESALSVTVAKYERHIQMFRPAVDLLLMQIAADPNSAMLRRLLAIKKSLKDFEGNVINVSKIIQSLLLNDDDMAGLYLTNINRRVDQHEEVELLLESYLADLDDIQQQIKKIKETIEDTNQFIGAHLDTTRNKMIRMGLFMEMGMLSLGSGALIAGIFGMNLTHGLETSPSAFFTVCGSLSLLMVLLFSKFRHTYTKLKYDTTSANSFKVLKNFLTYVDDLEEIVNSSKQEITDTEFKKALDKLTGQTVPPEEAEFIFQMFDKDKDRMINISTELKLER